MANDPIRSRSGCVWWAGCRDSRRTHLFYTGSETTTLDRPRCFPLSSHPGSDSRQHALTSASRPWVWAQVSRCRSQLFISRRRELLFLRFGSHDPRSPRFLSAFLFCNCTRPDDGSTSSSMSFALHVLYLFTHSLPPRSSLYVYCSIAINFVQGQRRHTRPIRPRSPPRFKL